MNGYKKDLETEDIEYTDQRTLELNCSITYTD